MKIGIMTFSSSVDNYGQILQLFALQRYLRNQGHDAFVIKYREPIRKKNPLWLRAFHALNPVIFYRYFWGKGKKIEKERETFPRHFEDFLDKYVCFSPVEYADFFGLKENPPKADIYIAGSDQIWSEWFFRNKKGKRGLKTEQIAIYFLNFGNDNIRRISYAASWGRDELLDDFAQEVKPLLKRFSHISIREKSGLDICQKLGFDKVKWVCDPTLLLEAEEYRKIYRENPIRKPERKYLLLYFLSNKTDFNVQVVYNFAKKKDLDVVYVTGNGNVDKYEKFFATIPEWLYLIDNAEYIVSNSFHASVFSTIFGKQYGVIPCSGKSALMNSRLDSLFEMCNIESRWLKKGEGFDILDKPYKADISSFRQESIQFLNEAIDNI